LGPDREWRRNGRATEKRNERAPLHVGPRKETFAFVNLAFSARAASEKFIRGHPAPKTITDTGAACDPKPRQSQIPQAVIELII
jgi:hypothetical protein